MRLIFVKILFIVTLSGFLQGCETLKNFSFTETDSSAEYADWDIEKFREQAKKAMDAENYPKAIELYQALESRYPFGDYSEQTKLDLAYAYYKNDDYEAALATTDSFVKINPQSTHIDYVYYLRGLINFSRGVGFLYRFLPTDSSQRDVSYVQTAYDDFAELVRLFPTSQYIPDARQRMVSLRNDLAMHEIHIARFYFKRKAYLAAVNRAAHVVKKYDRTPAVPYALKIMETSYIRLGMQGLADDAQRIYAQNYPDGPPIDTTKNATFIEDVWDFLGLDEN